MFDGADPFANVDNLVLKPEEVDNEQQVTPVMQHTSPVLVLPRLPDHSRRTSHGPNVPCCGDGWYVAYHTVLLGVYCGV